MKIVLINDEGQSIASFEPPVRPEDRSPAQAFALLDLLEKFLEGAALGTQQSGTAATPARPG